MAFTWTTIVPGVTEADSTHVNEIMINTNSLADTLGIAHYTWTNLPVSEDQIISAVQGEELRDALDYIDDNSCTTQNTVYLGAYCASHKIPHDSAVDLAQYGTVESVYNKKI